MVFSILIEDLKYGDPLFSALFIVSAKVLTQYLSNLFSQREFTGFRLPK